MNIFMQWNSALALGFFIGGERIQHDLDDGRRYYDVITTGLMIGCLWIKAFSCSELADVKKSQALKEAYISNSSLTSEKAISERLEDVERDDVTMQVDSRGRPEQMLTDKEG